ncbi:hypothetical protein L3X38_010658 [Prunus dulcis]|uniref:Uncharacterized protein n=1 Tax=Prunus dulcis TaxID=3755 RepID=A0AAD4WIN9_PRUDU|nr:hypothetical protein L3X38_010658 [Prunus dulcis]
MPMSEPRQAASASCRNPALIAWVMLNYSGPLFLISASLPKPSFYKGPSSPATIPFPKLIYGSAKTHDLGLHELTPKLLELAEGSALRLPMKLECSITITQKLTSSQPRSYFSTANLRDYCLHHSEPSRPSIKATSTKAATPSSLSKEDTLPRCQTPAEAPNCQT